MPSTTTMPPTTTKVIKYSQSAPTLTVPPASDKENPGFDTTNKQRDPKDITTEEMNQIFREAEEEVFKMSAEEIAKSFPWLKYFKNNGGIPPSEVPDEIWDEI